VQASTNSLLAEFQRTEYYKTVLIKKIRLVLSICNYHNERLVLTSQMSVTSGYDYVTCRLSMLLKIFKQMYVHKHTGINIFFISMGYGNYSGNTDSDIKWNFVVLRFEL